MAAQHAQNTFTDMFKNFTDVSKFPQVDFGTSITTIRRNVEAASAANQALVEGVHAAFRRSAEIARSNTETALKATRELIASGSPEQGAAKHISYVKDTFENSLSDLREVCEMTAKSCFEAFDVLNKRMAECMEECSETTTKKGKKSA